MKRTLTLLILVLPATFLSAQEGFGDCIMSSLMNVDSTVKDTVYNSRNWKDCVLDKPVPDINLTTITGQKFQLKRMKGKVIVLNFWFTHCIPCIEELPALNKLVKAYKK